jgi:PhzF family phenazine biosynthesis protein
MRRGFRQVDVFGEQPFLGNPVAVVLDGAGLSTADMQALAVWTNLSETTFVLPPDNPEADYRLRIFTLAGELPFAGHPTLGSCHAWLEAGGRPSDPEFIVQECGAGLVRIRRDGPVTSFAAPPLLRSGPVDPALAAQVFEELGISEADVTDSAWVDNGPGWLAVLLRDPERLAALQPELGPRPGEMRSIGVVAMTPDEPFAYEVRAFFTDAYGRTVEDPVTGSLNASLAQWLLASERVSAPYAAAQGLRIGRQGRVSIQQDERDIWVGGSTVTLVDGVVEL